MLSFKTRGIFCCLFYLVLSAENLYDYLRVSKSASLKEIKSAYRREASKWHPDKNPSKETEAKFIEITKAYEVLSNPERRKRYDAYGEINFDGDIPYTSGTYGPSSNHEFFENIFGELFSSFRRPHENGNIVKVTFQSFRVEYLPASRTVPLMFLGFSNFCFTCRQIEPLWFKLANQYSHLGVRFGVGNLQADQALREELNLLHTPSIVAVIDRKISYFTGTNFDEYAIVDFLTQALIYSSSSRTAPIPGMLSTSLGSALISTITTDTRFDSYLAGWLEDSKPRAVFFKVDEKPPLRFCLAALRAADFYAFAFIDTRSRPVQRILERFKLPPEEESIAIFHEVAAEPVVSHSASLIVRSVLDTVLMQSSRLAVPRILSPVRFLEVCPADDQPPSSAFASAAEGSASDRHGGHRHLCLVLLLRHRDGLYEGSRQRAWLDLFRSALVPAIPHALASSLGLAARLPANFLPVLAPAHLYIDKQGDWLRNITTSSTCPTCLDPIEDASGYLMALWRISSRTLAFRLLPKLSNLHPAEIVPRNATTFAKKSAEEYSSRLKTVLERVVLDMVQVQEHLKSRDPSEQSADVHDWSLAYMPQMEDSLKDELAAPLWLRIKRKLWNICCCALSYLDEFWSDPIDFILTSKLTIVVLGLCLVYRVGSDVCWELFSTVAPQSQSDSSPSPSSVPSNAVPIQAAFGAVTLLTPSTYDRLITNAPKGQITVVLCTDGSPLGQRLSNQCLKICARIGGSRLVVSSLHVDRHPEWFGWALEAATRIPFRNRHDQCNNSPVALTFNPSNCRGTVFAVNGYRRYFHMYHRLLPGSLPRKQLSNKSNNNETNAMRNRRTDSENGRRYANFNRLLGLNQSDTSGPSDTDSDCLSSSEPPPTALMEQELLTGLHDWFDRLFEGSLRRYQVANWPRNLTLSD